MGSSIGVGSVLCNIPVFRLFWGGGEGGSSFLFCLLDMFEK